MTDLWMPVDFGNGLLYDKQKGFDIIANWGGTIEVSADAKYQGNYGCKFTVANNQAAQRACGIKNVPYVSRFRQAFYLHPHGISLADTKYIKIARNYHSDSLQMKYQIHLYYAAATGYNIQIGMSDNTGVITSNSGYYPLSNQNDWNLIETDWQAGSPGHFQLWLNGVNQETLTQTNDLVRILYPTLGTVYCTDFGAAGSYYIDYWRANDTGTLIGA